MNELGVIGGAGFGESMQIAADSLYVLFLTSLSS